MFRFDPLLSQGKGDGDLQFNFGRPNYLGKMLGPRLCRSWICIAGPLADAVLYNTLFAVSAANLMNSYGESRRFAIGICAFSVVLRTSHLAYSGPLRLVFNKTIFLKRYKQNWDIETFAAKIYKQSRIPPILLVNILRISFGMLPLLSLCKTTKYFERENFS